MKFTVVFSSHESEDCSYGLVFTPCPIWMKGEKEIINLNQEYPEYKLGSAKRLIDIEKIDSKLNERYCLVIVHEIGNGNQNDLINLVEDLRKEKFKVRICSL
jgi:ribosome maturation protein Sdo1